MTKTTLLDGVPAESRELLRGEVARTLADWPDDPRITVAYVYYDSPRDGRITLQLTRDEAERIVGIIK